MPNSITPADTKMIDRLLDEIFEGVEHRSTPSVSAHRDLLVGAVDDRGPTGMVLVGQAGARRTHFNDNVARTPAERARDNDTDGTRRRARETKERNELL